MSWVTATYLLFMVGPWIVCAKKVTQDGDWLWERPGLRLEGWGFEPPDSSNRPFREGRGPIGWGPLNHKVEDSTNHACIMKPQQILGALKLGEPPGWPCSMHAVTRLPRGSPSLRTRDLHVRCSWSQLLPCVCLPLAGSDWHLFCYNKTLIVSRVLSWVLGAILANYQIRESPQRPPSL